ncbi:alpha/beta hydrolase [Acidaminobacter sp. JC074]|uniref:alpha/beta hydrolase n=1 Tax=Acidaminobacter sp. JC074 TaxID=2530199 RepID=UPI001F0F02C5|nr:alpha/beta hydrolase [Acidaminobacter sp. JC074]MCH4890399.1 alpha/beta hydrolase [Acidaminobacter sp. JC074]
MKEIDESLFEYAEEDLKSELNTFLNDEPQKVFDQGDHCLTYYDVGDSDTVIMILPSSNGYAITFYRYMLSLSENFRVIVPDYQAGVNLETQSKGFLELARSISPEKLYIFGYSFGGIVAQIMTRMAPDLVAGIAMLDSETKTSEINPKLVKKFVKSYKRLDKTFRFFSEKSMHQSLSRRIAEDVKLGLDENRHFWEALYKQALLETSQERMRMIYDNVREFWMSYELNPSDFESYKGKILVLEIGDASDRIEVRELKNLFKDAKRKVYETGFRMSLVNCYEQVVEDLRLWIKE